MLGRLVPDFLTDQFDGTSGLVGWVGSIMAGHFGGPEWQPVQIGRKWIKCSRYCAGTGQKRRSFHLHKFVGRHTF